MTFLIDLNIIKKYSDHSKVAVWVILLNKVPQRLSFKQNTRNRLQLLRILIY